jgi:hypothetical protein
MLVSSSRGRRSRCAHLLELGKAILRPVVEEFPHDPVEPLVGRPPRLVHVVVDQAEGHRPEDGFLGGLVAPCYEERPLGGRIKPSDAAQELRTAHPGHPLVGEHHGHFFVGRLELSQPPHACLRRALTDDAVILAIALAEFAPGFTEAPRIVIDGEQHRLGRPRGRPARLLPGPGRRCPNGNRTAVPWSDRFLRASTWPPIMGSSCQFDQIPHF